MRIYILTALLCLTASSAFAQHSVTVSHKIYNADKDFSRSGMEYNANLSGHNFMLGYERVDGRSLYDMRAPNDNGYDPMQMVGVGYYYFGPQHVFGAFAGSTSDRPFASIDVTSAIGFYGYSVYSRELGVTKIALPDGNVFERKRRTALYLGVGASIEPIIFGGFFLPVFSYIYEGEWYTVNLGLPLTAIAIHPNMKHLFAFQIGFQGRSSLSYEYKMTPQDTFKLEYVQTFEEYRLSDQAKADSYGGMRRQITYAQEWFRFAYTRSVSIFEISGSLGYMPMGYYFKGKYFKSAHSREMEDTVELGMSIKAKF